MNIRVLGQLCLRCGLVWQEAASPNPARGFAGVCPRCGTVADPVGTRPARELEVFPPAEVPNGGTAA